jgi:phosphomethylpyrimidine synthase
MHDETLPQEVFKSAKFCSMRITQGVRKLADDAERVSLGMATAK